MEGSLSSWEDWSARYGYPLVATPLFEATELFERGVGDTSEVVTKQMYTFSDKRGRSLTLRPEGTAGVVRAYLNAGLQGQWKGAYSGPFFRYEQPQKGRSRQFWQVGVEYLGVEGPVADVEVIELGHRFLTAVGATAMELRLNSIGDSQCRPEYVEVLRDRLTGLRDELSDDSQRLIDVNPLRVLDSKVDRGRLQGMPRIVDHLCKPCSDHYQAVKEMLTGMGIGFVEDDSLVRGLDYYTRTAFEFIGTGLDAAQNALGGGGRYDGLAEAIGGHAVPGVGFALGFDRVVQAIDRGPVSLLDAYLVSEVGPEPALAAASRLRAQGLRVDLDGEGRSVKAQFRTARRLEAPVILVYKGDDQPIDVQWDEGRASVGLDSVAEYLKGIT
jgi:histidyl-tRNA synthetase